MATATNHFLPGQQARAHWMRVDTAEILKRFFFCERALVIAQSGWLAGIASYDIKTALPRHAWEDAKTANELRERVFELRYPSRLMEIGTDAPLVEVFSEAINAPSAEAFVLALAQVLKPALLAAYREYVQVADPLADGPTIRFLQHAVDDKAAQIATLTRFAEEMLREAPGEIETAQAWAASLSARLMQVGGVMLEQKPLQPDRPVELAGRRAFALAEAPVRDPSFQLCRYYWPDVVNPDFPYGTGMRLQLRSAVSHFNEVWAVESGGAILHAFADELPWEFIYDAARWTYDEARHTRMGYERLRSWGFEHEDLPLGSYIYDSAAGQEPYVRLGMLHYFETKNIGKKTQRAEAFASYDDRVSQHDMDFDWADETIHAHYGRRWYDALHEKYPERIPDVDAVRDLCDRLVADEVASATDQDKNQIHEIAGALIDKAERTREAVG